MAKFDVEAAYRNIAVHLDDRYLLGMKWRDQFFVNLALLFGLRYAPYIFNSVADMVEWTHLVVLGIELDSIKHLSCLLPEKLANLQVKSSQVNFY